MSTAILGKELVEQSLSDWKDIGNNKRAGHLVWRRCRRGSNIDGIDEVPTPERLATSMQDTRSSYQLVVKEIVLFPALSNTWPAVALAHGLAAAVVSANTIFAPPAPLSDIEVCFSP